MVHEDELPGQEDLRTLLGDAKLRFGFWHPLYCFFGRNLIVCFFYCLDQSFLVLIFHSGLQTLGTRLQNKIQTRILDFLIVIKTCNHRIFWLHSQLIYEIDHLILPVRNCGFPSSFFDSVDCNVKYGS